MALPSPTGRWPHTRPASERAAATVIALADKAQQRLCRGFRRLAEHKPGPVATVAVPRELVGVLWAALHPETA